jgi:ABC-2 type transport system permease protein
MSEARFSASRSGAMQGRLAVGDVLILAERCLRLSRRNLDALLTSLMLPIVLMLLFVGLFGGAIHTGITYVDYVVPGVVLLCVGFGASLTAVSVSQDMTGSIVDRFRSMDLSGGSILAGHVAASVARNAASTVLVFGVAYLIGFRSNASPAEWLTAIGLLFAFALAFSWLSAAIGLLTSSPEAAGGFTWFVTFLPYVSSAFVPIDTMPGWLQGFARNQPVTPVIEALRGLLEQTTASARLWVAIAWCGGILVAAILLSGLLFQRRAP